MGDFFPGSVTRFDPKIFPGQRMSLRPFAQGERLDNLDGTFSTERSVTLPLPDGRWVNVPSLWMAPDGPVDLDGFDDAILEAMRVYEGRTGEKFQRFGSVEEAVEAARARSIAKGAR